MIRELPKSEQPSFRLQLFGRNALSDCELLALLISSDAALADAYSLLAAFGSLNKLAHASQMRLKHVCDQFAIPATRIVALLELSQRLQQPDMSDRITLKSPDEAASILGPVMRHLDQEELRVVLLNIRQQIIGIETIYHGSLHASIVRIGNEICHFERITGIRNYV